jgi:hypothetical protein
MKTMKNLFRIAGIEAEIQTKQSVSDCELTSSIHQSLVEK